MMLLGDPVEHGWDLNGKVKWSDFLVSYDETGCDNDSDNDFEVSFDYDDDEFDITHDEKEFSDED